MNLRRLDRLNTVLVSPESVSFFGAVSDPERFGKRNEGENAYRNRQVILLRMIWKPQTIRGACGGQAHFPTKSGPKVKNEK